MPRAGLFLLSRAPGIWSRGQRDQNPLLQPSPVPATPFAERLRTGAGRRTLGIGLALLIEALLLFLLLSLGTGERPAGKERSITLIDIRPDEASRQAPEEARPEPEQRAEEQALPQQPATEEPLPPRPAEPPLPRPAEPKAAPTPPAILPIPFKLPSSTALPASPAQPAQPSRPVYGPPNAGGSLSSSDTERVGTAPNGEPLYAAAWYRKPRPEQLRGYLSTASGPGWGLIACRTAPDYRVEDCVGLDEYPTGSQINRAVLAAAWEFKVRPPQLGGRPLVGSWVRIRIDYGIERR